MSCVENKKLLGQKADLSARLKSASGSTSTSYASVLNGVAPDTNTLLPEFSGTILGPVIPQRPIRPESTGTAPNALQSGAATSATGHSADGSLNISGDGTSSVQTSGSTDVAEHSAGSEASGGGTSSEVSNTLASETEVSAGSVATAVEGGALIDRPNESELASTSDMILIPLPPAAPAAEGDNKETEEMETESPSAADDAAELNTPHPKLPCEEEDAKMPVVKDLASCESKTHSLSSISGTESEGSARSDHCILGGDFNCVIASKDATGTSNHSLVLKNLTSNLGLKDAWEVLKANQIAYSFIRPNCSSRLDRLYVSGAFVPGLRTAEYLVTSFTDHKAFKPAA
ncbi:pol-like protein [Culex quinquefasciatus]|uniref:Pol-like protein n=1 Tax=Culex quinquefasciatus TaxID=7176 RepID=B0XBM6_CULQU|nr:pol-like protein [Culex quinquefasciatus]|eukprot:XP_001867048.1 pol-like protein [Culex quinquefasciatus]